MKKNAYQALHQNVARWYKNQGRKELPWRNTPDPYAIYLSEIMLQQTQVKTVSGRYYFPFLERFPDLESLASAPLQDVLKQWEGLGYYTRARNLHKTAQLISPALPAEPGALVKLPGIGLNTAHAILAFAFRQPYPVMEANVKRILCRYFALKESVARELWSYAWQILDRQDPFTWNQAMMDIGALICTRQSPKCFLCPLQDTCQGKASPDKYPSSLQKKPIPVRKKVIYVYRNKDTFFLSPRKSAFLQGLFGFEERDREHPVISGATLLLGNISQSYSHFTLEADVYLLDAKPDGKEGGWYNAEAIASLPLSKADQKVMALLQNKSIPRLIPGHRHKPRRPARA